MLNQTGHVMFLIGMQTGIFTAAQMSVTEQHGDYMEDMKKSKQ